MNVVKMLATRLPRVEIAPSHRARWGMRFRRLFGVLNRDSSADRLGALRRDVAKLLQIHPVLVAKDQQDFVQGSGPLFPGVLQHCSDALRTHPEGRIHLRRFCLCCNETTSMLLDYQSCRTEEDGTRTPNWRERLICSGCGMNNRQRLVAKLAQQAAAERPGARIYLMEQVTPIFQWVREHLDGVQIEGSEYLGHQYEGGTQVDGLRHEDVMNLSYPDGSFDLIVSNDVLEHIPQPDEALRECCRVLKPGGTVLATFPFNAGRQETVVRARLSGSTIEHLLPAHYHGNPMSSDGSLVFQDFGWDLLGVMKDVGFVSAVCEMYASDEFGHFGLGLLIFRLTK